MEVKKVLYMKNGENGYAQTSKCTLASMTKAALEETIGSLFSEESDFRGKRVVNMADLGCAAGPNTFSLMSTVTETVEKIFRESNFQIPEIQFYLNDLPGNDFNALFTGLSGYWEANKHFSVPSFVMAVPGSFHRRLFPTNSIHLIHSCYSLHWLSQGLVEEEKLDSFDVPYYTPSKEEVEELIDMEGSFTTERSEILEIEREEIWSEGSKVKDVKKMADVAAKSIRGFTESIISHHFGEETANELYVFWRSYMDCGACHQSYTLFNTMARLDFVKRTDL